MGGALSILATLALVAGGGHGAQGQAAPSGWEVICGGAGSYLVNLATGERRPLDGQDQPGQTGCHGLSPARRTAPA